MEIKIHNMVLKRFILILLFLSVIFVAASISYAADNNTTNTTNQTHANNTVHKLTKNSTLPDPTNTRTGKHYTSIQTAINEATSGDTITLEAGTYYENLVIDKSINLIGAGKDITFINGQQKGIVIYIFSYITVNISRVTITNGLAPRGGGIYNKGTLTLQDSNIKGNTAAGSNKNDGRGAGIYNEQGTVILKNSTVSGNTVTTPNWGGGYGAGIYNEQGTVTLQNSIISYNTATGGSYDHEGYGGGIYNEYNTGTVTLKNSAIYKNYASDGGGIYNEGYVILRDSTITDNESPLGGHGGIENWRTVYVYGTNFNCIYDNGYYDYGGNPIIWLACTNLRTGTDYRTIQAAINDAQEGDTISVYHGINYENLNIEKNINIVGSGKDNTIIEGGNYGYVIYIEPDTTVTISGLTIRNRITQDTYYCGGIYNSGHLTLKDTAVSGNTATNGGGGIYNYYGTLTLQNSQITGNKATGQYGGNGGGIYNAAGNITLINSIISGNVAYGNEWGGGYGGGIYNYGTVTLYNSKITGNTATGNYLRIRDGNYGGGIYNYWGSSVYADSLSYILYNSPNNYYDIWGDDIIPIPSLGGGLPPATSTNNSNSKTNVSAASTINSKTIGMQETGLPLVGLILAIFMVLGGLSSKRK